MGDRANFGFKQNNGDTLFLYGHWAGHNMLGNLAAALSAAEPRWGDSSYATRIATSHLIGDEWTSTTGWGFSINRLDDNEHKVPVVNWAEQTVTLFEEDLTTVVAKFGIAEFVNRYTLASVD
jgi:hypothetical protein